MQTLLQAQGLIKSYSLHAAGDIPVLKGINLEINQGEFIAFMGPSGAGKSTLLHILGLLDKPDAGTVKANFTGDTMLDFATLRKQQSAELRNKYIGFIFQFHHLLPEFSAVENVMMPALIAGTPVKTARQKANALLERVGMSHRAEHRPAEMSGGEQQRIAIARALINEPALIIADEPTGNLDSANTGAILELIHSVRSERPLTLLVATHSQEVAAMAERIIMLRDGNIEQIRLNNKVDIKSDNFSES
jgi:lipoprotein-releasing system ATP-binding protein